MDAIEKLKGLIPDTADCILITSELNQRYLTGLNYTDGYVVVSRSAAWLLADFRYIEAARKCERDGLEVVLYGNVKTDLGKIFSENKLKRIGFESGNVTCAQLDMMKRIFPSCEFVPLSGTVEKMREIKTPEEIEKIKAAQRIAEKAFDRLLKLMTPNMTEKDVALELEYGMKKLGAEKTSFDTIAISGSASSMPHGIPHDVKLKKGFLTMDFGAVYDGYCSDMTRTVVLGKADAEMKKVYGTVLEAQLAAIEFSKEGALCSDCDKIARDIIDGAGYEGCFGHALGHAVGMYVHEKPVLSCNYGMHLKKGNVVTVEPGIYIEGKYGVRIEDMIYISENGTVDLTETDKELLELF